MFPVAFVTGRPMMTIVFSLLISSIIFSCFLIKFVNHRNNIGLLYWEISMLITTLQIHQGIMMQVKKLYSFLENNNLAQLIAEPTRVTCHSLTILDLVTTTFPGRFSTSRTLNPPSSCDHSVIFSNMNIFAMYSKVRLSIKRRDRLLRFTINAHLQPNVGTLIGLNVILVSHLYDLPKKAFYERVNKDLSNPDINSKKWWSVVRRV